jgi:hypothetical protein
VLDRERHVVDAGATLVEGALGGRAGSNLTPAREADSENVLPATVTATGAAILGPSSAASLPAASSTVRPDRSTPPAEVPGATMRGSAAPTVGGAASAMAASSAMTAGVLPMGASLPTPPWR